MFHEVTRSCGRVPRCRHHFGAFRDRGTLPRRAPERCIPPRERPERPIPLRNASAARALLAALPEPHPEIEARVGQLERELDEARSVEKKNARLAREMDATVSAAPRFLFLGAMMLVVTGVSTAAYLGERRTGHTMTFEGELRLDFTILSLLTIGLFVARRRLLTNAFNRITWALWYIGIVAITLSDIYLGHVGVDPARSAASAFGIMTLVFVVGAVTFSKPFALVALALGLTSMLAGIFPQASTLIATIGVFFAIAVNMEITRRTAARAGG